MAITLVGTAEGGSADGSNVTINLPVGTAEDDVVILFGGRGGDHAGSIPAPGPVTSGYTQVFLSPEAVRPAFAVHYKVMGSIPDTQVVGAGSPSTTNVGNAYGVLVLRGVDIANVLDAVATDATAAIGQPDSPSVTTVTNGAWVLSLCGSEVNDAAITEPSGYTKRLDFNQADSISFTIGAATIEKAVAGAENPGAWSNFDSNDWRAVTVAIRPSSGAGGDEGEAIKRVFPKEVIDRLFPNVSGRTEPVV
jgi:hypothetical protein